MPTVVCPVEGFEEITITYPDEWLYKHLDQYHLGLDSAPKGASEFTKEVCGTLALCEKIEGLDNVDLSNLLSLPLYYLKFFSWLKKEVHTNFILAISPPKKKMSSQPQTTPKTRKRTNRLPSLKKSYTVESGG